MSRLLAHRALPGNPGGAGAATAVCFPVERIVKIIKRYADEVGIAKRLR